MSNVRIVTDSSCDLAQSDIGDLDIAIVPLTIRFGDEEFTDGENLTVEAFYKRMAATDELPQTACPAPGAFERSFTEAADAGSKGVVCLTLSSNLSNTYQSAKTAVSSDAGTPPVHVVDSKSVSSGLGTMVLEAAKFAERGGSTEDILSRVNELIPKTHVMATLNTLDNLKKGGRIGGAKAMLGSVLSIKPLIDISGGVVSEAGKARTRTRARQLLYERMVAAGEIEHVAVMHGGAPDIEEFLRLIEPTFPRESIRVGILGAVVGVHGGAEIIGASWASCP